MPGELPEPASPFRPVRSEKSRKKRGTCRPPLPALHAKRSRSAGGSAGAQNTHRSRVSSRREPQAPGRVRVPPNHGQLRRGARPYRQQAPPRAGSERGVRPLGRRLTDRLPGPGGPAERRRLRSSGPDDQATRVCLFSRGRGGTGRHRGSSSLASPTPPALHTAADDGGGGGF